MIAEILLTRPLEQITVNLNKIYNNSKWNTNFNMLSTNGHLFGLGHNMPGETNYS